MTSNTLADVRLAGLGLTVAPPAVRRITVGDVFTSLRQGLDDFRDSRAHLILLALIYPVLGLVLGRIASGAEALPLIYPIVTGFALLGPFAAVGLYEMSKRREAGKPVSWGNAFDILRSPQLGAIVLLGLLLGALFVLWLYAAQAVFEATLGRGALETVASGAWLHAVFTTPAGWMLLIVGNGIGFVFAVAALILGVVSFPLLVDRPAGPTAAAQASVALRASAAAVWANKGPMVVWGAIVAGGLILGSIPLLVGLAVVMPILGHATWHLYRKLIA